MTNETAPHAQGTLTLLDVWAVLSRRRWVIVGTFCLVVGVATAYLLLATRYYKASSRIQLQKEGSEGLNLDSLSGAAISGSDALQGNINIQTQADILQSETLALKVIKDLDLEHTPDFQISGIPPRGGGAPLELSPRRRVHAVTVFRKMLSVQPVAGTKLIDVSFNDQNPERAAQVVNALVQALIDYTFQTRYKATTETSAWLTDQLADLRKESERLQAKVVAMQKQTGVFSTGDLTAQGRGQNYSSTLDQLQQATAALSQAQSNRILKGAIYEVVRTGDPEAISTLSGTTMANASPGVANSLSLLQSLQTQEATTEEAINKARTKYGPQYPDLIEMEASLRGLQHSIRSEGARIAARAKTDYEVAALAEGKTQQNYEAIRRKAETLNDHTIDYAITREEAQQSSALYEDLLRRLREAGVLEGLHSSNITVVDMARQPAVPETPRRTIIALSAVAAGLVFGCIAAFIFEAIDDSVQSASELEQMLDAPLLAILPQFPNTKTLPSRGLPILETLTRPKGPYAEAIRVLRSSLLLASSGAPPQVISFCSAAPSEGKSTVIRDLAVVFSQRGQHVLLVEADLRRPVQASFFGLADGAGLSQMLTNDEIDNFIEPFPLLPAVSILTAGAIPPFPADLLDSDRMRRLLGDWRKQYDLILLDGPPILPVVDSLTLAQLADFSVFLVRSGTARRASVRRAIKLLAQNGPTKIGVVLNGVDLRSADYYDYYGYRAAD